jgi:adenylate cyclase
MSTPAKPAAFLDAQTAAFIQRYVSLNLATTDAANDSIFIDEAYLIKGVAGAICWKLLQDYTTRQRREFSNRELRLDPSIGLPEIGDNLEARLILLQKRLVERCDFLRLVRTGRGRFQLQVDRPVSLSDA